MSVLVWAEERPTPGYVPVSRRLKRSAKEMGPLITAAACGWVTTVELLLANNIDVNHQTNDGCTALLWANSYEISRMLLDAGANVNLATNNGTTPLIHAITNYPNTQLAELLLKRKANPNLTTRVGNHPMHFAAQKSIAFVKLLLKYGSKRNPRNSVCESATMVAANAGKTDIVAFFIQRGCNWIQKNRFGRSVIDELISSDSCLSDIPDFVIRKHLQNAHNQSKTSLMRAAKNVRSNGTIALKRLISLGANINEVGCTGLTALLAAVEHPNNNDNITALLGAGANPNVTTPSGLSCTYLAARSSNFEATINLLLHGAPELHANQIPRLPYKMQVLWLRIQHLNNYERAVVTGHHIDHLQSLPNTEGTTYDMLNWLVGTAIMDFVVCPPQAGNDPSICYPKQYTWSLAKHSKCPDHVKNAIKTVYFAMNRLNLRLPQEILEVIWNLIPFFGGFYLNRGIKNKPL